MVCFLKTPASTKCNLRFSCHMSPGDEVFLTMPRIVSYLSSQNREIAIFDPFIPAPNIVNIGSIPKYTLPPTDVESPNFTYFDFVSHSIEVFAATPQDNLCTGNFCDDQSIANSCPCTIADNHEHWSMCLTFNCAEVANIAREHVTLVSKSMSRVFISDK